MPSVKKPYWWNPIGALVYEPDKKEPNTLKFTTRSGHLHISKEDGLIWVVRWIIHSTRGKTDGYRHFTCDEFSSAFDLRGYFITEKTLPEFAKEFDGEFGLPDLYIRTGCMLNIPGPGTGIVGDTNFSLKLTSWNKSRIKEFMDRQITLAISGPH